jgi:Dinucleotide-utilizing enzymes involved in molybdopterin and thiamine biosynthesis family 1
MKTIFERTQMLLGASTMNLIRQKKIIVFGVGGVGSFAVEALVRAGIHLIALVDPGIVEVTDINRQIIALHSTLGRNRTEVMEERIKDINPEAEIKVYSELLTQDNIDTFQLEGYDYIVDAVNDLQAKLLLIREANRLRIPIISSMDMDNKFNPTLLRIEDVKRAGSCPMSKLIRKETARMGIKQVKALFSVEEPHREEESVDGSRVASSISFVPSTAGLLIASEVIKDLLYTAPTERAIFGIKLGSQKLKIDY